MVVDHGLYCCHIPVNEFCIGHRSVSGTLSVSTASDLCTLLLLTMHMRTVCIEAKQKNAKLNNWTWLNRLVIIGEHENKFIVGGASVVCVVSQGCPIFMVSGNAVGGC